MATKLITFFRCTGCGHVSDMETAQMKYYQSKPHNFFWGSPGRCGGTLTLPATEEEWVKQECRPYPWERIEKFLTK